MYSIGRSGKHKQPKMVSKRNTRADGKENDDAGVADYEQSRQQRIKDNLERMHKLGILDLSRNLKPPPKPKPKPKTPQKPSPASPRRSSRLKTMPPVSYSEKHVPNSKDKPMKDVKIEIKEGSQPEVYTEEHEKVLGDHKETWILAVDGYDADGNKIYDAFEGKSCHQCRQKTAGLRTKCSKCNLVQGQFCGDCLFMRYGENVVEANANPDWVCPVCRDICNCSRCRRVKGWEPTGNLYRKALYLGFKSVAHYLIQTRGPHGKQEALDKEDEYNKNVLTEKNMEHHDKGDDDVDPDYRSDSSLENENENDDDDSGDD